MVWREHELVRIFRSHEVTFDCQGILRLGKRSKFPGVMALLAPEHHSDVPARWEVTARRGRDVVECAIVLEDLAQIVVPNETDFGVTVLNECVATFDMRGCLGGRRLAENGRSALEFLTVERA
jgi:hypothetical protein